jgi:hypothetical protein
VDRTDDLTKADWLLLVSSKLQVDGVDTNGESPLSVAERYYQRNRDLTPHEAVGLYMAHRAGLQGRRKIVAKDMWIDRFVDHLQPSERKSIPNEVKEFAQSAYEIAWDLLPEEVANTFTAAHRAELVNSRPDASRQEPNMPMVPRDEWVPRFAKKLREMLPEVSGSEAMDLALAEATFPEAEDLTPEEAVEIYLLEEPPADVGRPADH